MSDEISTASAQEGATGGTAPDTTSQEGVGAAQEAAPAPAPGSMQEKISKHRAAPAATPPGATPPAKAVGTAAEVIKQGASPQPQPNPVTGASTAAEVEAAIQAYAPNFKYKFNREEKEIPELFRQLIKDAETEKLVRDLHERADYADFIKPKFTESSEKLTQLTKGLEVLDKHIQRDPQTGRPQDLGKFLAAFDLTDKDIFDYTQSRLEYLQMPPDQRQKIDSENALRERAMTLEEQYANTLQEKEQLEAQHLDMGLRSLMNHPSISPVVEKHPGGAKGFYQDVAMHAWHYEASTGQKLLPEQAVLGYIQSRGLSAASAPASAQAAPATPAQAAPASAQPQPTTEGRAPTLPNVPSQGTSPAKKMVGSLKDLKKVRDQKLAELGG